MRLILFRRLFISGTMAGVLALVMVTATEETADGLNGTVSTAFPRGPSRRRCQTGFPCLRCTRTVAADPNVGSGMSRVTRSHQWPTSAPARATTLTFVRWSIRACRRLTGAEGLRVTVAAARACG